MTSRDHRPGTGGFSSLCDEPASQKARVLYDYEGGSSGEINLVADEVISLTVAAYILVFVFY